MKNTKRSLLLSAVSLLLCFVMVLGTTYAWFTDTVASAGNRIVAGSLKVDLLHSTLDAQTGASEWVSLKDDPSHKIFDYELWEPGYTRVEKLKVANLGNLALKYQLTVAAAAGTEIAGADGSRLSDVIDVYYYVGDTTANDFAEIKGNTAWTKVGTLSDLQNMTNGAMKGNILPEGAAPTANASVGSETVTVALHMQEEAGNEYQNLSVGDLYVNLIATQYTHESDSFGDRYDEGAIFPDNNIQYTLSAQVTTDSENKTTEAVSFANSTDGVVATLPAGALVEAGTTTLTLTITELNSTNANVTVEDDQGSRSIDVHVEGIAEGNTVPVIVNVKALMRPGLNIGNYTLYHIENDTPVPMTYVTSASELDAHNEFTYDPVTGDVSMALASFSEVAAVADQTSKWTGNLDYDWYLNDDGTVNTTIGSESSNPYIIANADQLAGFGAIVGGMDGKEADDFSGKYVKLIADINLGDKESENNPDLIFYPIGYYSNDGLYKKTGVAVSTWLKNFCGTFDGNGNTVSNFYQNTWEMKGDHDWYDANLQYYRDGMGLFGRVYGATIKNLTVDNFSCDSEIGTTGCIAAYADCGAVFENISITNCNPRVYNIGNGGIVGCAGWYNKTESTKENPVDPVTFRNITVDQTNKISALWGSWGVSCAGILGQYYPKSGQSSANYPANTGIYMENCHVAAIIDVNNDVCSNYQYYWYRYAGMFIGTIRANTTDNDGYTVADTTGITAKDCTYTMGNWNEYWYCEIVANSLASYTHDHQFSRLDNITSLGEIQDANGNWNKEGHFALLDENRDIKECIHIFKNSEGELYQHFHDVADESNPDIYETFDLNGDGLLNDLKEDRQCYFIPFNQLFTGLDMGIKAHTSFEGIKHVDDGPVKSEKKFEALDTLPTYRPGQTIKLGDIVNAVVNEEKIAKATLNAMVSPAINNANTKVSATYTLDAADWKNGTIKFGADCSGAVKIVINDYFYCTPTVIVLNEEGTSEKFTANNVGATNASQITLGALFGVKDGATIGNVTATVTAPDQTVTTITGTASDWTSETIFLTKAGEWTVSIADDDKYCAATTVTFTVNPTDKFKIKFPNTDKYLYRVGNANTVALGSIFEANGSVSISNVNITVENVDGCAVECTYTPNTTWTSGTIRFTGTGVVKVTISADGANPLSLYLEVVDAVNATSATDATSNNVVLLNDIGSGFTVSGRYTVYGNGFTLNYTGKGQYLNNGLKQGVVTVSENGTLDNLIIKASIYPRAYMYYGYSAIGDYVQSGPSTVEGDKTRYHYQLSAVAASGNATISNCYIYGGRTNVFVNTGDVTIKDSVLECGVVANVQVQSDASHTVTLENVTTIQYRVNATIDDTSKVMLGAGILVGPETNDNPYIVLNGSFKQYNWVTADDENDSIPQAAQLIVNGALGETAYNHTVNGKTASNLGIIYMNEYAANVDNNTGLPYALGSVTMKYSVASVNGQVYSLKNATSNQICSDYANADKSTANGLYVPQFKYDSTLGGQHIAEGGDEHCYRDGDTIRVMFPSGDTKELDLAALVNIDKYTGQDLGLEITAKDSSGNAVALTDNKIALSSIADYTVTYTVTDALFYDKDGNRVDNSIGYSWDVKLSVTLKDSATPNAYFEFDASKQVIYRSGNSNIVQFIPFLRGLKIYDYNGQTAYLRFDGDNDFKKIAKATIDNVNTAGEAKGYHIVTIELTDGGKLVIDMDVRANTGSSTHSGSIKVRNNELYVVNGGTTSGKGQTWKIYNYKFTGNNGAEIESGLITFGTAGTDCDTATKPSSNFSTTIKYTVTYNANGGNCGQTTGYATNVSAAVTLPTPTRSGYIFAGWYTAASGGTRAGGAGDSYTPSANVTLYAQWGKPCTVTYNANGGSCDTASQKYTGTVLTLPTPTRDGYWFVGWYDAATGGNKIGDAGATYLPGGEITLYARWQEKIEYTVTYNANGGSCSTASATYQGTALTLPTPTREGYTFNGWYTAASGGTKIGDAGATYTPSANVTLYAQWTINSYTIKIGTQSNATVTVDKTSAYAGDTVSVTVTFSKKSNKTLTVTDASGNEILKKTAAGAYTFTMPASNVTISASSTDTCLTPDTLVTLADGTQVRVDALTGEELLLVWNHETGMMDVAPVAYIVNHDREIAEHEVITLTFSDGKSINIIGEHVFYNVTLGKYMPLDTTAEAYIGHSFLVLSDGMDGVCAAELVKVEKKVILTEAYEVVSYQHLTCFTDGILSTSAYLDKLLNIFDIDAETYGYTAEKIAEDIATYGLYTYADFEDIITEEAFELYNAAYLKIAVGKGYITWDDILDLVDIYFNVGVDPIH